MPTIPVTLIKGDKLAVETDYRDQLPVNMYAVERDILGAKGYMMTWPGIKSFGTGQGKDRGGVYNERFTNHFRVSGQKLIEVDSTGTVTSLGTITGTIQAAMPYSFNTQCVITDGKMYLYDSTSGFRQVTDADLGNPIDGVWVDGYYFLTDGEYIYHTDLTDESSIDPLKFATAEFMPDPSLGLAKTQDNKVLVFGRYTLEYFVNVATSNFAFQRVETRAQKIGIVATHAKCEANGNFYITGGRKEDSVGIHRIGIGSSTKVSTREVDKVLAQYTEPNLSDMRMESRSEDNVTFILVHLPDYTLCFNETIAENFGTSVAWSIVKTDASGDDTYRAINGIFDARNTKWLYGDKLNANIGELDKELSTHYGAKVETIIYSPMVNLETGSVDEIEIETIPGHTSTADATVAFSMTTNGVTYGKEYWQDYGDIQDYEQRFFYRRVGYVRDWIGFKFRAVSGSRMAFALMKVTYG